MTNLPTQICDRIHMKKILLLSYLGFVAGSIAAESAHPSPAQPSQDAQLLLQQGLFEEEANRNLKKAAEDYSAVIATYESQRNLASTALFRLATIRAKEGKDKEAIALFQRVLTEFPNDETLAKMSREHLAQLGGAAPTLPAAANGETISSDEQKELHRLADLVKNSPDLVNVGALDHAAENGWLRAAAYLLDHGAKITGDALVAAAGHGRKSMVELLLSRGGSVDQLDGNSNTALVAACVNQHLEVIRTLLDHGANPNIIGGTGNTSLYYALSSQRLDIASLLLDHGANPDLSESDGNSTPFTQAIGLGDPFIKLLLDHHADPNKFPQKGSSPLVCALLEGNKLLANQLLSLHADPNLAGSHESPTPLLAAIVKLDPEMIKQLLERDAKPDLKTHYGYTALHYAVLTNLEIVNLLLDHGASVNIRADNGETPLRVSMMGRLAASQSKNTFPLLPEGGAADGSVSYSARRTYSAADFSFFNQALELPLGANTLDSISAAVSKQLATEGKTQDAAEPRAKAQGKSLEEQTLANKSSERFAIWQALAAKGADLNAKADDESPLSAASRSKFTTIESLKWLINHGAKLDAQALRQLDSKDRLELQRLYLFGSWVADGGIAFGVLPDGGTMEPDDKVLPLTSFDAPPTTFSLLKKHFARQIVDFAQFDILVYRKHADGEYAEISRTTLTPSAQDTPAKDLPSLQWGDVVVAKLSEDRKARQVSNQDWVKRIVMHPFRKITVHLGEEQQILSIAPDFDDLFRNRRSYVWSAIEPVFYNWTMGSLFWPICATRPGVQTDAIRLQRSLDGKQQEWTVNLRELSAFTPPAPDNRTTINKLLSSRLQDGDQWIAPLLPFSDPQTIAHRKTGIFRLVGGRVFTDCPISKAKENSPPPTLCEFLTYSYANSNMLIPSPDLSHIVIRRLGTENGKEIEIPVDLTAAIRKSSEGASKGDLAQLDIPLTWGDYVVIPPITGKETADWRGFDADTLVFFNRILSREATIITNEPHRCEMHPPARTFHRLKSDEGIPGWTADGDDPGFSIRKWLTKLDVNLDKLLSVTVKSAAGEHRYTKDELNRFDPLAREGDAVSLETL